MALTVANSGDQVGRQVVKIVEVIRLEVVLIRRVARDCQQLGVIQVGSDPDRDQRHVLLARVRRCEDRGGPIIGPSVRYDDSDVGYIATVTSVAGKDVRAHGVDGAGRVRGAAGVVEAQGVRGRVLCRVGVQIELDVRRVGVGFSGDAALPVVQIQAGDDLTHEVDLLDEVRLADAAGVVKCECDVRLHPARCNNYTRVCTTLACADELTSNTSGIGIRGLTQCNTQVELCGSNWRIAPNQ